ncbi:MAG: hypothetical protein EBU63_07165 [Alphaproteobacteria bacterium]|nr:hypothetical protein [Alphaproteobacteria bacterium]
MAKPKQPSARPGDMIDGEAVEKPAQTTAPRKADTKNDTASSGTKNDTAPSDAARSDASMSDAVSGAPDSKLLAKPLPMFQAIIFAALGLSVFAIGLAGFAIWQHRHHAAEMAVARAAVANQQNFEKRQTSPGQPSQDINSAIDQAALDERLAALMARLARERESQQAALAALQDQLAISNAAPNQVLDLASSDLASSDLATWRADMDRRFAALEAGLADRAIRKTPSQAAQETSVPADPANRLSTSQAGLPSTGQTGLLVVSGLLADNLAGQPLDRWVQLLQGLVDRGVPVAGLDQLRQTANPLPASAPQLIQDAYNLVPQMTTALNRAGDNAGFLEKIGAKIGQLVQLRPIGDAADGNAMALRQFEAALAVKNLAAALRAAEQWSGVDLPPLDRWVQAATARQSLDKAVNVLVTSHLAAVIKQP